jgi:hypothetical protein
LFSPPLVADGTNFFDCYLVNVSLKPRKVRIDVISREGDVVESVETTLGPGQEDVARATSDLRPRYCKFVVQGAKQLLPRLRTRPSGRRRRHQRPTGAVATRGERNSTTTGYASA